MDAPRAASGWTRFAAALTVLLSVAGCGGTVAPTTLVDMRSLPDNQQRRAELLDSAAVRPGPENRKPLPSSKLRQVETAAATGAAILGILFSNSPNVLLGVGTPIGWAPAADPGDGDEEEETREEPIDADKLVPWVKLRPPDPAADPGTAP